MQAVIYISGAGRSGSTLLERILHSAPEVSALGEFRCLWSMAPADITCACGTTFDRDPYWQAVVEESGIGAAGLKELQELEGELCRTSFIARHGFSVEQLRAEPRVRRFLDLQFALLEAVARKSGTPVLVDSSKSGPRVWLMACDERVTLCHLYRSPTDVIASWRSRKFDPGLGQDMRRLPIWKVAYKWVKWELLIRRMARHVPVAFVDYVKLCANPRETVEALLKNLALPEAVDIAWNGDAAFDAAGDYHSINGNPDRFQTGTIAIRYRAADWSKYGLAERVAIRSVGSAISIALPPRQGLG